MISDPVAEVLEQQGLWRRASERWLEVMRGSKSEEQNDQIRRRCNRCMTMLRRFAANKSSVTPKTTNVATIEMDKG